MNHIDVLQHWLDEATQKGAFKLTEVAQVLNALSGIRGELEESAKKSKLIGRLQKDQELEQDATKQVPLEEIEARQNENTKR